MKIDKMLKEMNFNSKVLNNDEVQYTKGNLRIKFNKKYKYYSYSNEVINMNFLTEKDVLNEVKNYFNNNLSNYTYQ